MFPMPKLKRSVALFEHIEHPQRARLSEIEKMVKKFKRENNYSSVIYVMDTVDGVKHKDYKIRQMIMDEQVNKERAAMENHERV